MLFLLARVAWPYPGHQPQAGLQLGIDSETSCRIRTLTSVDAKQTHTEVYCLFMERLQRNSTSLLFDEDNGQVNHTPLSYSGCSATPTQRKTKQNKGDVD